MFSKGSYLAASKHLGKDESVDVLEGKADFVAVRRSGQDHGCDSRGRPIDRSAVLLANAARAIPRLDCAFRHSLPFMRRPRAHSDARTQSLRPGLRPIVNDPIAVPRYQAQLEQETEHFRRQIRNGPDRMKPAHSLIIGGTRGIGREVVRHFISQGHKVSVIARRLPERKADRISRARYWSADVCDQDALTAALKQTVKTASKINYLVFLQRYRGAEDSWQGEIATSLTATKSIVETLQDQFAAGDKAIVIVSSINGALIAGHLTIGYHLAKAALQQMVRYWAVTLGARGIRVNSVSPGTILKEESKRFFLRDRKLSDLYSPHYASWPVWTCAGSCASDWLPLQRADLIRHRTRYRRGWRRIPAMAGIAGARTAEFAP